MSEKDLKLIYDLGVKEKERKLSREGALQSLMDAGILNKKGKFTEPYKNLERVVVRK
jgi:hypothetical protein